MAFKTFDRTVFFALETTEGSYNAPTATTGYIECIDPTYTVTPRMFERDPTSMSITPQLQFAAGTSKTSASASVELTFTVEMAGSGTAATAPRWSTLLKACGFEAADGLADDNSSADANRVLYSTAFSGNLSAGVGSAAPLFLFHKENFSTDAAATTYNVSNRGGRVIGDVGFDERIAYGIKAGATDAGAASDNLVGEVSKNYGVASGALTASGVAWFLTSGQKLGGANNSSLSFQFVIDAAGTSLNMAGARGNVEFVMAASDRVLMNFTFTGFLQSYTEGGTFTPTAEGRPIPPAFIGCNMLIQDSSYGATDGAGVGSTIFNNVTININNDVVLRDNPDSASGYSSAYITGRSPSMTWNPDAVLSSVYDFWERFLVGEPTRARLTVGTTTGNKFHFKMPAIQFTGMADGNRDEVVVYDTTSTLTGGGYGSSVNEDFDSTDTSGDTALNKRMGTNNEFCFYQL